MTALLGTGTGRRAKMTTLAFAGLAGHNKPGGSFKCTGYSDSPLDLWEHIYSGNRGDRGPLYMCVFSGVRPPSLSSKEGAGNLNRLVETRSEFFLWTDEMEGAAKHVEEMCQAGREAYHCAHLLTGRRRVKENAAPVAALYVDGDGAKVPKDLPQPTLTVESSPGRHQFYWRLTRPIPPEKAEDLNKRLAYAMGADKSGWDLTQLLRPPGTRNHKYARVHDEPPTVRII